MNTIADLIDLEHAAADEAHVTGLPLEHCQQYVRRNAELIARFVAGGDIKLSTADKLRAAVGGITK